MKDLISTIVFLAPTCVVIYLAGDRFRKEIFKWMGLALFASALSTWLGVRFFDLNAPSRSGSLEGTAALTVSMWLMALGVVLFGIHYLVHMLKRSS